MRIYPPISCSSISSMLATLGYILGIGYTGPELLLDQEKTQVARTGPSVGVNRTQKA
jgi:hypothetical protein